MPGQFGPESGGQHLYNIQINLLTLFALVLAIGIVVDDAIVVVEAVHAKMELRHLGPHEATIEAMHEITGAIVSITFVMAAVFLPVGFMDGSTGLFYRQFAFTMATAIIISAINALTLSPALTALILKDVHAARRLNQRPATFKERFFEGFNSNFESLTTKYTRGLKFLIGYKWATMAGLAVIAVGVFWLVRTTKTGFIPTEDQGFIAVAVDAPSGTSLSRTSDILKVAESVLGKDPATRQITSLPGFNLLTGSTSPSAALVFVVLKDPDQRGKVQDINLVMEGLRKKLSAIKKASFFVFSFPTVPGFSNVEALDFVLQDKLGGKLEKFSAVANKFIAKVMKKPAVAVAFTSFKADYPQLELQIDHDKADQLGIKEKDILQTMQVYFGGAQVSDFNRFGKYYRVIVEADKGERADVSSLGKISVKNSAGEIVPISSVVSLKRVYGAEVASRYILFNSIEINAIPKPGYSSGEAIEAIKQTAAEQLPSGFSYDFVGQTREEILRAGNLPSYS